MDKFISFIKILVSEKEKKTKVDYATSFVWFHFRFVQEESVDADTINNYFLRSNLSKYNSTYLKEDLKKSRNVTIGNKSGTYKPKLEYMHKLDAKFEILFSKSEEIICDDLILPESLYKGTRGYIENLSKQVNASYEKNIFDGCAILMRRLLEILLIQSYCEKGRDSDIKDNEGYKNLNHIINYTISNKVISTLSKDSLDMLDEFRQLEILQHIKFITIPKEKISIT